MAWVGILMDVCMSMRVMEVARQQELEFGGRNRETSIFQLQLVQSFA